MRVEGEPIIAEMIGYRDNKGRFETELRIDDGRTCVVTVAIDWVGDVTTKVEMNGSPSWRWQQTPTNDTPSAASMASGFHLDKTGHPR